MSKDASSMLQNRLIGGTFEDIDIKRALDLLSVEGKEQTKVAQQLRTVDPGWFFALGRAISKERLLFRSGPVETSHPKPGSAKHASEPPPTPNQVKDLLPKLADLPKAAEEKARTLEEMRTQIRSLKGELAAARREKPAAPVVDQAKLQALTADKVNKAVAARDREWMRSIESYRRQVERVIAEAAREFAGALHTAEFAVPQAFDLKAAGGLVVSQASTPPMNATAGLQTQKNALPALPVGAAVGRKAEGNGDITQSQLRILNSLAECEALGRTQPAKTWVAAMTGVSNKSSGYQNNLGSLRTRGYVDYPQPGLVALTAAGRDLLPPVDPPTTSDEMLRRCLLVIPASQGAILRALYAAHPRPVPKIDLAEQIGVSSASSGYQNNLGALRTAGMIDYPEPGKARAADWLFLE